MVYYQILSFFATICMVWHAIRLYSAHRDRPAAENHFSVSEYFEFLVIIAVRCLAVKYGYFSDETMAILTKTRVSHEFFARKFIMNIVLSNNPESFRERVA